MAGSCVAEAVSATNRKNFRKLYDTPKGSRQTRDLSIQRAREDMKSPQQRHLEKDDSQL